MGEIYLEEIDSTNKYAKLHINDIPDKTIVYTYNQTAGRGRLNREWCNIGSDNIYASIVLKPSTVMKDVYSNLTQYLCVVLAQTFEEYDIVPKIKWPNDIQVNGKKISGILAESVIKSDFLEGLVLGVGINLNTTQAELDNINQPATSLNIETGKNIDKKMFLERLINNFFLMYDNFIKSGFNLIREDYLNHANFLNKKLTVRVFDKDIIGIANDVNECGALKITDNNNIEHVLLIGDIL
ncbi:MAG: biotin--[acetyl-CoA-carboxylase] ligase [bacterium]|nr:biotin--[acetyl-CoA-carboxylase] ligase [bacterium]